MTWVLEPKAKPPKPAARALRIKVALSFIAGFLSLLVMVDRFLLMTGFAIASGTFTAGSVGHLCPPVTPKLGQIRFTESL